MTNPNVAITVRSWPGAAIGARPRLQPLAKIAEFVTGGNVA